MGKLGFEAKRDWFLKRKKFPIRESFFQGIKQQCHMLLPISFKSLRSIHEQDCSGSGFCSFSVPRCPCANGPHLHASVVQLRVESLGQTLSKCIFVFKPPYLRVYLDFTSESSTQQRTFLPEEGGDDISPDCPTPTRWHSPSHLEEQL